MSRKSDANCTGGPPAQSEDVNVECPSPQRYELEVKLNSPALVVLADVYYPGWKLTIDDKPATDLSGEQDDARRLGPFRAPHRLVYTYTPRSFRVGRSRLDRRDGRTGGSRWSWCFDLSITWSSGRTNPIRTTCDEHLPVELEDGGAIDEKIDIPCSRPGRWTALACTPRAEKQPKVAPGAVEPDWKDILRERYGLSLFADLRNPVKTTAPPRRGCFGRRRPGRSKFTR